jgi:hypothetical protein
VPYLNVVSFDHIRYRRHDASAFLYAFDLIALKGDDLRRDPLEPRGTFPLTRFLSRTFVASYQGLT